MGHKRSASISRGNGLNNDFLLPSGPVAAHFVNVSKALEIRGTIYLQMSVYIL